MLGDQYEQYWLFLHSHKGGSDRIGGNVRSAWLFDSKYARRTILGPDYASILYGPAITHVAQEFYSYYEKGDMSLNINLRSYDLYRFARSQDAPISGL